MGNRDDLLAAAKRSLIEKGYAHTTARELADTAGVSLAAIGYHFRSTQALLNLALTNSLEEWAENLGAALHGPHAPAHTDRLEEFEWNMAKLMELLARDRYPWVASFQLLAQIDHVPELRQWIDASFAETRPGLAYLFHSTDPPRDPQTASAIGAFYQALMNGIMIQWMADDKQVPSAHELAFAMRRLAGSDGPAARGDSSEA